MVRRQLKNFEKSVGVFSVFCIVIGRRLVLLFTLGGLLSSMACSSKKSNVPARDKLEEIPVYRIHARDTILQNEYVANIQAVQNVELRARVEGFLEKIYVDEGQEVRKSQILFKINDEEYKAEVAKAHANLQNTIAEAKAVELELDRIKILVQKDVVSKSELEVAEAKLDAIKAKVNEAQSAKANAEVRLSYTSVRAPFDGVLDRIPLKAGSLIENGSLLTTVSNLSAIYVYFNVSENEYLQIRRAESSRLAKNTVRLILSDGSTYRHQGKIETMESEFKSGMGSIAFRAKFSNPDKLLKHGATGKIILFNGVEDALLIPQKAVFELQDKSYVYIVDSANQVKMKTFVPGTRLSQYYIVRSGLSEGDRIVFEGIQTLKNGMTIKPKIVRVDSVIALANRM